MAYLILPGGKRTRQPQGVARPAAPFADALSCAAIPGLDSVAKTTTTGSPARVTRNGGIISGGVGNVYTTSAYHDINLNRQINEYTLICISSLAHADEHYDFLNDDDVGARRGFQLRYSSFVLSFIPFDASNTPTTLSQSTAPLFGTESIVAIVARAKAGLQKLDTSFLGASVTGSLSSVQLIGPVIRVGYNRGAGEGANTRGILGYSVIPRFLSDEDTNRLLYSPWQLFASDPRRIYFGTSGGTGTTNERTIAARAKARGAATTATTRTTTAAGRVEARAAATTIAIHAGTAAGRLKARGTDTVAPLRTESAAGRIRAKAANTVEHIDAGAVSRTVAGKVRARGAAATLAIRATSIVGRVQARGADTVTSTRLSLAAGRVRGRAAVAAAPVIAGMVTTTAAGRLRARGSSTATLTRLEAVAGRVTARGTDTANSIRAAAAAGRLRSRGRATAGPYVAPTLPLEVPESTRVLIDKTERLGASPSPTIWDPVLNRRVPAPRKPPRLG